MVMVIFDGASSSVLMSSVWRRISETLSVLDANICRNLCVNISVLKTIC